LNVLPYFTTAETVVILRGVKADSHVKIDLDVEKLGFDLI